MKLLLKIVAPVAVLFTTATAVAFAAPVAQTTVYPEVPANPDVCRVEKLEIQRAQLELDAARAQYERILRLVRTGAASPYELRQAERAVHLASIKLNAAKYAEAACRNNLGNDPNNACIARALELNRLIDELPMRQEIERLATADYEMGRRLVAQGAMSREEFERLRLAKDIATIERQQTEQRIADQRRRIADTPACRNFPSERPELLPPPREVTPTTTPPAPN
jgi:multidrug resistance efflux pump